MDDAVALILYAVASTLVGPLLGGQSVSLGSQLLNIAKDILGSIIVGGIFGAAVTFVIKNLMHDEEDDVREALDIFRGYLATRDDL